MHNLRISANVAAKLAEKHQVRRREVEQSFENKWGVVLEDSREDHQTDPATVWFIAPTNAGRPLKVVFIFIDGTVHLKTAYEPNPAEIALYERFGSHN